jgi:hypothetical protein
MKSGARTQRRSGIPIESTFFCPHRLLEIGKSTLP